MLGIAAADPQHEHDEVNTLKLYVYLDSVSDMMLFSPELHQNCMLIGHLYVRLDWSVLFRHL